MAVGDVNPVLEANKVYYDVATGVVKFGRGDGTRWDDEQKACVEPAPTDGPYLRGDGSWVSTAGMGLVMEEA